jgi:hypothetical protein
MGSPGFLRRHRTVAASREALSVTWGGTPCVTLSRVSVGQFKSRYHVTRDDPAPAAAPEAHDARRDHF